MPKCPSLGDWLNKVGYKFTTKNCETEKNQVSINITLECLQDILSEKRQI